MTLNLRGRSIALGLVGFTAWTGLGLLALDRKPTSARDRNMVQEIQGDIVPHGKDKAAFKFLRVEKPTAEGGIEVENRYLDSQGSIALLEQAKLGPNAEVLSYRFEQRQTGDRGGLERIQENGKERAQLSFSKKGKPTEVSVEEAPTNLVVGPSLIPYLFKHREELLEGKEIPIRLAVPERLDTYGFSIRHRGRADWKGQEVIRVEMRPTSIIIRQLVDAISIYMDLEGKQLLGYAGRMPVFLRESESSSWDAFQGLTVYQPNLGDGSVMQARTPGAGSANAP
jgi:hypothetical protein